MDMGANGDLCPYMESPDEQIRERNIHSRPEGVGAYVEWERMEIYARIWKSECDICNVLCNYNNSFCTKQVL